MGFNILGTVLYCFLPMTMIPAFSGPDKEVQFVWQNL